MCKHLQPTHVSVDKSSMLSPCRQCIHQTKESTTNTSATCWQPSPQLSHSARSRKHHTRATVHLCRSPLCSLVEPECPVKQLSTPSMSVISKSNQDTRSQSYTCLRYTCRHRLTTPERLAAKRHTCIFHPGGRAFGSHIQCTLVRLSI